MSLQEGGYYGSWPPASQKELLLHGAEPHHIWILFKYLITPPHSHTPPQHKTKDSPGALTPGESFFVLTS